MKDFSNRYLELLTGEFGGLNLTRILDPEEFYEKQIMDSLIPSEKSKIFDKCIKASGLHIDIGFGGGFPILPLAKKYPNVQFLGMEARGKKAKAVQEIANKLELDNAKLLHQRYENVFFDNACTVTFKAVGKVEDMLARFVTNSELYVFFYKGPNFYELENLDKVLKQWDIIEETLIDVPGTEGRMLIGFKNKNVLRGTNPKKNEQKSCQSHRLTLVLDIETKSRTKSLGRSKWLESLQ